MLKVKLIDGSRHSLEEFEGDEFYMQRCGADVVRLHDEDTVEDSLPWTTVISCIEILDPEAAKAEEELLEKSNVDKVKLLESRYGLDDHVGDIFYMRMDPDDTPHGVLLYSEVLDSGTKFYTDLDCVEILEKDIGMPDEITNKKKTVIHEGEGDFIDGWLKALEVIEAANKKGLDIDILLDHFERDKDVIIKKGLSN